MFAISRIGCSPSSGTVVRLPSDQPFGFIGLRTKPALASIAPEAWDYKLGNRCALEWIPDQYKEKKPKDPTIRAKLSTYRFADYKEKLIDLLARLTTVSVETQRIVGNMQRTRR